MRISADESDRGYHQGMKLCTVYLEGAARNNVITADEEGRFAITARLDEFGRVVLKRGIVQTDNFYGAVRIDAPAWVRAQCEGEGTIDFGI
jgi:hypothetical protein